MDLCPTPPGCSVVTVPAATPMRRCLAPAADVVVVVVSGAPRVGSGSSVDRRSPGDVVLCPRAVPWSLAGGDEDACVVVVAVPPGPERALPLLVQPGGLDEGSLLAAAADAGLQLVLAPVE